MKTIKVIDLLNKIANGNIPKRIIYDEYVYELNEGTENYEKEIDPLITINWDYVVMNCLNDEVEIIEEKKIPKKLGFTAYVEGEISYSWSKSEAFLKTKINEIIDYLESKEKGE